MFWQFGKLALFWLLLPFDCTLWSYVAWIELFTLSYLLSYVG